MQQCYQVPQSKYISVVRSGKLLFRFDKDRGLIEMQVRGEKFTIDLSAIVEYEHYSEPIANQLIRYP